MKNFALLLFLILSTYTFSQIKTTLILNDGTEKSGYIFENGYTDIEQKKTEDVFKIFLYDGEKQKKSSYFIYDQSEIKEIYIFNKKNQKIQMIFVKPTQEKFDFLQGMYYKIQKKSGKIKYENAWILMILVESGKDLQLLADYYYLDFKVSKETNLFVTDYYNRYYVKEKNSEQYKLLGIIDKANRIINDSPPMILGKRNYSLYEERAIDIFSKYCPSMVDDIRNKKFIFKSDIFKIFDYYLKNCN